MRDRTPPLPELVGSSPPMKEVRRFIRAAAETDVPLLLEGETGTGKTLVARVIHEAGPRADAPFLSINCAGIPESLFESELFGHEKGAFTGAASAREGLIEAAGGGTLFLDEVGELPMSQQGKLLTVIEERSLRRIGGRASRPVSFRLISATGRDLGRDVGAGRFRRDLLHRVAVLRCVLPPLRARREDLRRLTRRMLQRLARRHRRPGLRLSADARAFVDQYAWPGNVRELAHVLEAATILAQGTELGRDDLEAVVLRADEAA